MPFFSEPLDHDGSDNSTTTTPARPSVAEPNVVLSRPLPIHQPRHRLSEESIRTDLCDGPLDSSLDSSLGCSPVAASPDHDMCVIAGVASDAATAAATADNAATSDRAELIERLKRGESPTWVPNRKVSALAVNFLFCSLLLCRALGDIAFQDWKEGSTDSSYLARWLLAKPRVTRPLAQRSAKVKERLWCPAQLERPTHRALICRQQAAARPRYRASSISLAQRRLYAAAPRAEQCTPRSRPCRHPSNQHEQRPNRPGDMQPSASSSATSSFCFCFCFSSRPSCLVCKLAAERLRSAQSRRPCCFSRLLPTARLPILAAIAMFVAVVQLRLQAPDQSTCPVREQR